MPLNRTFPEKGFPSPRKLLTESMMGMNLITSQLWLLNSPSIPPTIIWCKWVNFQECLTLLSLHQEQDSKANAWNWRAFVVWWHEGQERVTYSLFPTWRLAQRRFLTKICKRAKGKANVLSSQTLLGKTKATDAWYYFRERDSCDYMIVHKRRISTSPLLSQQNPGNTHSFSSR